MKTRIQKIISDAGIASRRAGEAMISAGRVTVNGITAKLGESADPDADVICVDGKALSAAGKKTYIMLNKPRGYVTSLHDEKGRKCVADLVRDAGVRLYPVGRLDMYSEGLLIMTDDGDAANRLMHPKNAVTKTYRADISGACSEKQLEMLSEPMEIDGYVIKPAQVEVLERADIGCILEIRIHEGRNRQIRKMCKKCSLKLTRLVRIAEGGISLGNLPAGKWRYLNEEEMQEILK